MAPLIRWRSATLAERGMETSTAATLVLDLPDWPLHRAGQHVDIRLTAEDGYQAQRSYSIAAAPEDERLTVTVERLDDGEVSPYLVDVMEPGDQLEVRGPIGGWFVWDAAQPEPLLLIAGGSGVVPLMSMLRHRADRLGRGGRRAPGRARPRPGEPQDRALRADRRRKLMNDSELRLDGNAAAGLLAEVFAAEMTVALETCANCETTSVIGATHVYANAPGVVLRCPACEAILLCIVRIRGRLLVDLQGISRLELQGDEYAPPRIGSRGAAG